MPTICRSQVGTITEPAFFEQAAAVRLSHDRSLLRFILL